MILRVQTKPLLLAAFIGMLWLASTSCVAQQVVQRGALGKPSQVLDETGQWTTPLLVARDGDVEIYIPDISNPDWLKQNYPDFRDKYQYVLTFLTFYRTPRACKANMIGWGYSDAAHLDACEKDIGYRIRRVTVDTHLKTVTLIMAAMVDNSGEIVPTSIEQQPISRNWSDLDANTQEALKKTTALISKQMAIYDRRMNGAH
ncbi:MAG TPA: hypothetical protein VGM02_05610 [Acidobacteriaceae bacterium]|jgi:hypothetical protein